MIDGKLSTVKLSHWTTEELKLQILALTKNRDTEPLSKKVQFYQNELEPFFEELSRRNPFPVVEEQVQVVIGAWVPVWSTIPFQDILPGRVREQSYQIFHDNGYYANIARYAPGNQLFFLQNILSLLLAYDLIVMQSFEVQNGHWYIQNVGIKQALRLRKIPLSIDKAEDWFNNIFQSRFKGNLQDVEVPPAPKLKKTNKNLDKKLEKVFSATPELEHLYIDREFRLVKTQREAKQRPSYTIAVRIR